MEERTPATIAAVLAQLFFLSSAYPAMYEGKAIAVYIAEMNTAIAINTPAGGGLGSFLVTAGKITAIKKNIAMVKRENKPAKPRCEYARYLLCSSGVKIIFLLQLR